MALDIPADSVFHMIDTRLKSKLTEAITHQVNPSMLVGCRDFLASSAKTHLCFHLLVPLPQLQMGDKGKKQS